MSVNSSFVQPRTLIVLLVVLTLFGTALMAPYDNEEIKDKNRHVQETDDGRNTINLLIHNDPLKNY